MLECVCPSSAVFNLRAASPVQRLAKKKKLGKILKHRWNQLFMLKFIMNLQITLGLEANN